MNRVSLNKSLYNSMLKHRTDKEIIELYNKIGSLRGLARELNTSISNVHRYFNKHNLKYTKGPNNRKHLLNEHYFDYLNDESLYWLGFIMADGSIDKTSLRIQLSFKDENHLHKIRTSLSSSAPIKTRIIDRSKQNPKWNKTKTSYIVFSSKYLTNSLKKYNIVPNKSAKEKFPQNILHHDNINNFVRGYIDGDGCFLIQKNNQLLLKIRGSKDFLKMINKIIVGEAELNKRCLSKKISFDSGTYQIQYNGNNICKKIATWLYSNGSIYLDRKKELLAGLYGNTIEWL